MHKKVIIKHNCFDGKYRGEIAEIIEVYSTTHHEKLIVEIQDGSKLTLYKDDVEPLIKRIK